MRSKNSSRRSGLSAIA